MAKVYDQPASVEQAAEALAQPEEDLYDKRAPAALSGLYRAAWRWHFYAGLFVIPVLVTLAVTGAIYLFKDQAEPVMYRDLMRVPLPVDATAARPLGEQVAAVQRAFPNDRVVSVVQPLGPTRSTQVFINPSQGWDDQPADSWAGGKRVVYVNPYSAEVLGHQVPDDLFMENVREVHNGLMAGTIGNRLVEIVASWTVILTVSGFSLWWRGREPRKAQQARGVLTARSKLRRRHAQVGALAGTLLLFFVISGLFWSGFWGVGSQKVAERIQGYPEYAEEATTSTPVLTKDLAGGDIPVPWAAERLPVPASGAGHHGAGSPSSGEAAGAAEAAPIGIDQAAAIAQARLSPAKPSLWINMPEGDEGVYTVRPNGHGTQSYTTLHIDQYSGKVLADYGYDDFGVVAKTISEGVNLHLSSRFGGWADVANTGVNLLMCVGVIFLAVTGPMMWWKRRPKGAFSPPRRSSDPRTRRRLFPGRCFPSASCFPWAGSPCSRCCCSTGRSSAGSPAWRGPSGLREACPGRLTYVRYALLVRSRRGIMAVSASQLRENIYRLLDQVLETGIPLEIERKGKKLRIVPADRRSKLDRVVGRSDFIVGDPDAVVHVDWSGEWKP